MTNAAYSFSPLTVGTMRLGTWGAQMTTSPLAHFIEGCLSLGLRDFDHADIYGDYTTESEFGRVFKEQPTLRDQLQLITKCGINLIGPNRPQHHIKSYDLSQAHILRSVEQSLVNLRTDRIDLLLLHRPDYLLHPQEVAEAFEQLKAAGKVRSFGVSNFSPSQFALLHSFTPLVTNQVEISITHLMSFDDGTLDQCLRHGIQPMAWSPLGGGAVFTDSGNPRAKRIRTVAQRLAAEYTATMDQILLAWLRRHPAGIVPVLGTTKLARVQRAYDALSIALTRQDWYELWQASTGKEVA